MPEKGTTKQPEFHLSLIAGENCDLRETVFRYCVEHDVVLLEQKVNTEDAGRCIPGADWK